ncbi:flagellar protein FliO/FliZ [Frigoribacterium sp. PvP120]|uniref:FliO/MopB family protein n=1 Tax=unclassified Frigoribacterium TaxID=2627005 RepID=UPI001B417C6E|nr:flagellar biosynthetic protein FliO [Frigoribacterium sp. PvP121]MBP1240000.1 flagellar biogenesis protein FliO [Frigoribacterium sp. PvP121]
MDTLFVALRVALSLGVVLALLWVLQKRLVKGVRGSGKSAAPVTVVARQGLGAKASVVVVDVEGERLVLGVTESSVTVLSAAEVPGPAPLALVPAPVVPVTAPQEARVTPIAPVAAPAPAVVPAPAPMSFEAVLATQPPLPVAAVPAVAPAPVAVAAAPELLRPRGAARRAATVASASATAARAPRDPRERRRGRASTPLEGSILAPGTWRQAAAALRAGRAG